MSHNDSHHFIVPVATYVKTFAVLLCLTVLTVLVALVNFGKVNLFIALLIAITKASLVASIFMGLKWDKGFNTLAFVGSLVFLGMFVTLTFVDIGFRGWGVPEEVGTFGTTTKVKPLTYERH